MTGSANSPWAKASASDRSSLLSPSLVYSISDEADLVVGAMLAFGPRPKAREYEVAVQMPLPPEDGVCVEGAPSMGAPLPYPELKSEFGTYPNIYFGEVKFYF